MSMVKIDDALNWIYSRIQRIAVLDGRDIVWERTPFGSRPVLKRGLSSGLSSSSSSRTYTAKTTGGSSGGIYPVDLYDEVNGDIIGSGYVLPVMLHVGEQLPVGTWIVAVSSTISQISLS